MSPFCCLRGLGAAALALALGGCGFFGLGGSDLPEPEELEPVEADLSVERAWSRNVGAGTDRDWLALGVGVADGRVYAAGKKGRVGAFAADTGAPAWSIDLDVPLSAGPGISPDTVLVGTREGDVIALDASNGEERWRARVSSEVLAAPAGDDGVVVVRTGDGRLSGLDATSGEPLWTYQRPVPVLSLRGASAPAVVGGAAVVGMDSGQLAAVALEDGQLLWERQVAAPRGRSELERIVDIDAAPTVSEDEVFAGSYKSRIVALELYSGEVMWNREIAAYQGVAASDDFVFAVDADDAVWGLERADGATLWKLEGMRHRQLTSPAAVGDTVVVADIEGFVHWLGDADGRFRARMRVGSRGVLAPPRVSGNRVFVLDRNGTLTAFVVGS